MRVLVTGGTGFIGSHLVEALLARGDEVRCLVRAPQRAQSLVQAGVELVEGELNDPAALAAAAAGASQVYHLAAMRWVVSREAMFRVNQGGVAALMDACAAQAASPTVVLVSSVAAGGPSPRGQLRIESDPPAPVSIYGESKLAGEQEAARRADRVPLTIVRPGIVFGPRDTGMLQAFASLRQMRFHPTPGFSPPPLSWIYVADLVGLLLRAGERGSRVASPGNGQPGRGCYHAACAEYPNWVEMGRLVRPMLSRPYAWLVPVPAPVAWCVASVNEGVSRLRGTPPFLSRDKIREALVASWACSAEAARRELDFTAPLPLAARFQETLDWYRTEKWL